MYAIDENDKVISHKGDSGPMSDAVYLDEDGNPKREHEAIPRVGAVMIVGSIIARTYEAQDYWKTTIITEILEEKEVDGRTHIKFKTKNSTYLWKS